MTDQITDEMAKKGYYVFGLTGEAGEVADHFKKMIRDDNGHFTPARSELIKKELGDVLWYVARLSYRMGWTLDDVAETNLEKLASRQVRGVIGGSGDNR